MLPRLDGWEVLRRLRTTKKTPVLLLTARDRSADRVRGLDIGADDYLVKPFDLPELLARLRALIRRSASEARSAIEIGNRAHRHRRRASSHAAGEPVPLTAREYALVEYLALHRGEVVTRTTLYEHLFDETRRHAFQPARRACLQPPQKARPRLHRHAARPRLLHRSMMHFPRSIRWRLQLWYGALLVAVLCGFGFTAFHLESARQFRRIDEGLQQRISVLVDALRAAPERGARRKAVLEVRLAPAQAALFGDADRLLFRRLDARRGSRSPLSPNAPAGVPKPDNRSAVRADARRLPRVVPFRRAGQLRARRPLDRRRAEPTCAPLPRRWPRSAERCSPRGCSAAGGWPRRAIRPVEDDQRHRGEDRRGRSFAAHQHRRDRQRTRAGSPAFSTRPLRASMPPSRSRRVSPPTPRTSCAPRSP